LPVAQRDQVMAWLFDPNTGIGLSMLRQPIGSSDFTDEAHYTYDDLPVLCQFNVAAVTRNGFTQNWFSI
jgi:hypothetical protein